MITTFIILIEDMNYYIYNLMFNIQLKQIRKRQLQLFISIFMFQLSAYIDSVSVVYLVLGKPKEEKE